MNLAINDYYKTHLNIEIRMMEKGVGDDVYKEVCYPILASGLPFKMGSYAEKTIAEISPDTQFVFWDYYKENNIPYVALHYIMDDKEYVQYADDGIDIKTFYDKIRNGSMPKTSQASYEDLFNIFEEIVKEGKDIFYLSFSSALSGSYHTSTIVANDIMEKYPDRKVKCIDSAAACGGEGLLLDMCIRKYNDGYSLDKLVSYTEETKNKIAHFVVADDLNHLHRGGRVSKVSAVVGGMLGIKPLIHVNDEGKLIPYGKVRGRKAAIESIGNQMKKKYI